MASETNRFDVLGTMHAVELAPRAGVPRLMPAIGPAPAPLAEVLYGDPPPCIPVGAGLVIGLWNWRLNSASSVGGVDESTPPRSRGLAPKMAKGAE